MIKLHCMNRASATEWVHTGQGQASINSWLVDGLEGKVHKVCVCVSSAGNQVALPQ